ncbi:MAG: EscU/YscU/HrcU family type III secretion system export apparatus switch protein [Exiguobacterium sp.]|jgi:flagellar biosynthesis protein|uniref:EscU/YscU/HrcU family type III secretion system export apparatus switch protein n=1 Tax=Exiguobacterium profundum TaxID=307643 RepID=A0ABY8B2D5_9BACL|nr:MULTISPECIES: EscU/YscU/HrcU family type III secretion system export apparatus switch protein [Exiguobacterium]QPI68496.1 EscU/YscU/HrcU family type III secretion system export apparatus switch protein [Exiguobacterium sp. PBE]MBG0917660.1 flagellar biosynthesis protein FlhS [Exiguobacterium sp. SRB7LM]MBQ6458841.1 EscU/YscU/HrcU family type III secretion system export apparatus switch protein [Exiguobacterium sp.]MBR2076745.1 EscU/YscU/HrcU family type III secretion system export apparatus 
MYQRMDLTKRKTAAVVRYDETTDKAPVIVARGTGAVAEKILQEARARGVAVENDHSLLGHLLDLDLGDAIPPQLYDVMAEVLLLIEELDSIKGEQR